MKIQLFIGIILSTLSFVGCEQQSDDVMTKTSKDLNTMVIKHGTSFGMCLGPCKRELTLMGDEASFTIYFNSGRGSQGGDPQTYKEKLTTDYMNELVKSVDFEQFKNLKEVIGCPDCADGGAEWVEITMNDSRHKVTFEHGQDVKEFAPLLKVLREKREYFENKYVKY
ncbi:hypothetical protein [Emticicia fluvialis]|uniref:hypothetical protein n=1 Tax=Emticicia fluvialis TaxID=2974474 RepID=UPI002165C249|nr:hypothetical protein [Emticicia fluvialis]